MRSVELFGMSNLCNMESINHVHLKIKSKHNSPPDRDIKVEWVKELRKLCNSGFSRQVPSAERTSQCVQDVHKNCWTMQTNKTQRQINSIECENAAPTLSAYQKQYVCCVPFLLAFSFSFSQFACTNWENINIMDMHMDAMQCKQYSASRSNFLVSFHFICAIRVDRSSSKQCLW